MVALGTVSALVAAKLVVSVLRAAMAVVLVWFALVPVIKSPLFAAVVSVKVKVGVLPKRLYFKNQSNIVILARYLTVSHYQDSLFIY